MSANASTLENIGDGVSEGLAAIITADGAKSPLAAFSTRSTEAMGQNRVECRAGGFFRASDQMQLNPEGAYYYNHRRGTFSFTVISQRQSLDALGADSKHGIQVGRCRWLVSRIAQRLQPAVIGGYEVLDIIDQGDSWVFDKETSTDRTELRFQIDLIIPPANYTDS